MEKATEQSNAFPYKFDQKDLIFAMGIRFWSNLVLRENISDVKQCLDIIDNLNIISESRDDYEVFGSSGEYTSEDLVETFKVDEKQQTPILVDIGNLDNKLSSLPEELKDKAEELVKSEHTEHILTHLKSFKGRFRVWTDPK